MLWHKINKTLNILTFQNVTQTVMLEIKLEWKLDAFSLIVLDLQTHIFPPNMQKQVELFLVSAGEIYPWNRWLTFLD